MTRSFQQWQIPVAATTTPKDSIQNAYNPAIENLLHNSAGLVAPSQGGQPFEGQWWVNPWHMMVLTDEGATMEVWNVGHHIDGSGVDVERVLTKAYSSSQAHNGMVWRKQNGRDICYVGVNATDAYLFKVDLAAGTTSTVAQIRAAATVTDLAHDPINDIFYANFADRLYKSIDKGLNWSQVGIYPAALTTDMNSIAYDVSTAKLIGGDIVAGPSTRFFEINVATAALTTITLHGGFSASYLSYDRATNVLFGLDKAVSPPQIKYFRPTNLAQGAVIGRLPVSDFTAPVGLAFKTTYGDFYIADAVGFTRVGTLEPGAGHLTVTGEEDMRGDITFDIGYAGGDNVPFFKTVKNLGAGINPNDAVTKRQVDRRGKDIVYWSGNGEVDREIVLNQTEINPVFIIIFENDTNDNSLDPVLWTKNMLAGLSKGTDSGILTGDLVLSVTRGSFFVSDQPEVNALGRNYTAVVYGQETA